MKVFVLFALFLLAIAEEESENADDVKLSSGGNEVIGRPTFPFDAFNLGYNHFFSKFHPPLMAEKNRFIPMPASSTVGTENGEKHSKVSVSDSSSISRSNKEFKESDSISAATFTEKEKQAQSAPVMSESTEYSSSAISEIIPSASRSPESVSIPEISESNFKAESASESTEDKTRISSESSLKSMSSDFSSKSTSSESSSKSLSSDISSKSTSSESSAKSMSSAFSSKSTSSEPSSRSVSLDPSLKSIFSESTPAESSSSGDASDTTSQKTIKMSSEKSFNKADSETTSSSRETMSEIISESSDVSSGATVFTFSSSSSSKSESDGKVVSISYESAENGENESDVFSDEHSFDSSKEIKEKESGQESSVAFITEYTSKSEEREPNYTTESSTMSIERNSGGETTLEDTSVKSEIVSSGEKLTSNSGPEFQSKEFQVANVNRESIEEQHQLNIQDIKRELEDSYDKLAKMKKRIFKKENVLSDLNMVIADLQTLCEKICQEVPRKYLIPDSQF